MLMGYHATFEEVDRPVQNDDYVTAAVKDIKGATRFAGENRMFVVGSENFPTEVNEGLVGMKKDESKEISWTPMGDNAEEVTIEVTINNVKERKLPELTDEFVKENFGFDTIAAMRDGVKEELEGDKTSKLPGLKENRAVAALSERLELEKVDEDYEQSVFLRAWSDLPAEPLFSRHDPRRLAAGFRPHFRGLHRRPASSGQRCCP